MLGDLAPEQVRVRFPPSPTGNLHVGNVRSALFNWVFARHYGGTFVLRVEDTDAGRNLRGVVPGPLRLAHLAGADLGRGPGVGGPYGPYIQSERGEIYRDVVDQAAGGRAGVPLLLHPGGDRGAGGGPAGRRAVGLRRLLPQPQRAAGRRAGGAGDSVGGPDAGAGRRITFDDLVRGPVRFAAAHVPDFVIVRGNGEPLYTLVNPVDDSLMEITHVLRGEDLLPSTPRQIVLYDALSRSAWAAGGRRSSVTCRPCWARATAGCPSGTRDPGWPSTSSRATCPRRC